MAKVADRTAVKAARGTKRVCKSCGAKFYDLNREEITCPACGAPFEMAAPAPLVVAPKSKPKAEAEPAPAPEETEVVASDDEPEFVSLEEAEVDDSSDIEIEDDVVDIDADDSDDIPDTENDDTFLETEDENDSNVTDIIGGAIKPGDDS